MTSETSEIKAFGVTLKGGAAKGIITALPWLVAIGSVCYSAWGPPSQIKQSQIAQGQKIVLFAQNVDRRLRAIEKKMRIESPEPLNLSDASGALDARK